MDLKSVLSKYNLAVFNFAEIYCFYLHDGAHCSSWFYQNYVRELGRLKRSELVSMSDEELEEFAVGCSVRSMAPENLPEHPWLT
jgi:hypothetical protein